MSNDLEKKIESMLVEIMSDGFNRSVSALEKIGAVDTKIMRMEYRGVGSKYYDVVTKEFEYTARNAAPGLIESLAKEPQGKDKC